VDNSRSCRSAGLWPSLEGVYDEVEEQRLLWFTSRRARTAAELSTGCAPTN